MKVIEQTLRHAFTSFSIATLFTYSYNSTTAQWLTISMVTWGIFLFLFILSWRIKKELILIFIKQDVDDHSMFGQFEKAHPKLAGILWEVFLTFASIQLLFFAFDLLNVLEVNGNRSILLLISIITALTFRIFDRQSYKK